MALIAVGDARPGRPAAGRRPWRAAGAPGDGELVRRARAGSREAAGELFARHWPTAFRAALAVTGRRAVADDVAQDAFERVFATLAPASTRGARSPHGCTGSSSTGQST